MTTQKRALGNSLERRVVEKATKAGVKASRQPRSGELKEFPADAVLADSILVEAKVRSFRLTRKGEKTMSVDFTWLEKVQAQAKEAGFAAGIVVVNGKGSQKPQVLCDLAFLLTLLQSAQKCA